MELTQLSDRAQGLTPCKRGFFSQISELDQLMEEPELLAAGKEEGPMRLGGTKARREVTRHIYWEEEKRKGRGSKPESSDVLSLCLDPDSCLNPNTF